MSNLSLQIQSRRDSAKKLELKNPVMNAAGCFSAMDSSPFTDVNKLGAYITKSMSLEPWSGNKSPRIAETVAGMVDSIGLENKGIDLFSKTSLNFLKKFDFPVIVSIVGKTIEEYEKIAEILESTEGVQGIEVNVSCPNLSNDRIEFGKDPQSAFSLIEAIRQATTLPLIVKLSPNVSDIAVIAKAVELAGADAVSLINSVNAMVVDLKNRKPLLGSETGGLSGPAIKPIALYMVWQASRAVKIPVIGMGGIMNMEDALEFFIAGASAVQVGAANFKNPRVMEEIIDGLEKYFSENRDLPLLDKEKLEKVGI